MLVLSFNYDRPREPYIFIESYSDVAICYSYIAHTNGVTWICQSHRDGLCTNCFKRPACDEIPIIYAAVTEILAAIEAAPIPEVDK